MRGLRWLAWLLVLVLFAGLPEHVPGYILDDKTSFSLGNLLHDLVDPLVLVFGAAGGVLAGRLSGLRATRRFFASRFHSLAGPTLERAVGPGPRVGT